MPLSPHLTSLQENINQLLQYAQKRHTAFAQQVAGMQSVVSPAQEGGAAATHAPTESVGPLLAYQQAVPQQEKAIAGFGEKRDAQSTVIGVMGEKAADQDLSDKAQRARLQLIASLLNLKRDMQLKLQEWCSLDQQLSQLCVAQFTRVKMLPIPEPTGLDLEPECKDSRYVLVDTYASYQKQLSDFQESFAKLSHQFTNFMTTDMTAMSVGDQQMHQKALRSLVECQDYLQKQPDEVSNLAQAIQAQLKILDPRVADDLVLAANHLMQLQQGIDNQKQAIANFSNMWQFLKNLSGSADVRVTSVPEGVDPEAYLQQVTAQHAADIKRAKQPPVLSEEQQRQVQDSYVADFKTKSTGGAKKIKKKNKKKKNKKKSTKRQQARGAAKAAEDLDGLVAAIEAAGKQQSLDQTATAVVAQAAASHTDNPDNPSDMTATSAAVGVGLNVSATRVATEQPQHVGEDHTASAIADDNTAKDCVSVTPGDGERAQREDQASVAAVVEEPSDAERAQHADQTTAAAVVGEPSDFVLVSPDDSVEKEQRTSASSDGEASDDFVMVAPVDATDQAGSVTAADHTPEDIRRLLESEREDFYAQAGVIWNQLFRSRDTLPNLTEAEQVKRSASVWLGGLAMLRYLNASLKMVEQGVWTPESITAEKFRNPVETEEGGIKFLGSHLFSVTRQEVVVRRDALRQQLMNRVPEKHKPIVEEANWDNAQMRI